MLLAKKNKLYSQPSPLGKSVEDEAIDRLQSILVTWSQPAAGVPVSMGALCDGVVRSDGLRRSAQVPATPAAAPAMQVL